MKKQREYNIGEKGELLYLNIKYLELFIGKTNIKRLAWNIIKKSFTLKSTH